MQRLVPGTILLLSAMLSSAAPNSLLIVANKGDHTLGFIDPQAGKQIATVEEGGVTVHELTVSPDGSKIYAPIYGDSGVGKPGSDGRNMIVVDVKTRKIVGNLDFGKGVRPHLPIFNPLTGVLYVSTELDQTISIIDPKTLKIVGTIPTGQKESHMFTVSHDGHRAYTANVGPGTVSVLDLDAKTTLKIIPISATTQRISITPDDKWVFTADQTKPRMAVIDTATNTVKNWIALPGHGYGTAVTPDGKWLVVAVSDANKVSIVDLGTMKVIKSLDVDAAPQAVVITPDGKTAYVSCDKSAKVTAIDTTGWTVARTIDAGKSVDGLTWVK